MHYFALMLGSYCNASHMLSIKASVAVSGKVSRLKILLLWLFFITLNWFTYIYNTFYFSMSLNAIFRVALWESSAGRTLSGFLGQRLKVPFTSHGGNCKGGTVVSRWDNTMLGSEETKPHMTSCTPASVQKSSCSLRGARSHGWSIS